MEYNLKNTKGSLRAFLISVLLLLTIGVSTGLMYLYNTNQYSQSGVVSAYLGDPQDEFAIPRQISELLLTTHTHLLGFSFIFFITGIIFYFNTTIKGFWKKFFLVEPFISVFITFASIWAIRYLHAQFVITVFIGATLTYFSYYFIAVICLYELLISKNKNN